MAAEIIMNDKKMLRKLIKERIASLTPEQIASADEAIMDKLLSQSAWQQAQTVFCYLAVGREIATLPLLRAALAAGKRIAAPLITSPGIMEARLISDLADLHPDRYGIPAPPPDSALLMPMEIDLVIVPGVAFARQTLLRLGRGGGYYDRYLSSCPALRIALAREAQLLDDILPAEAHDLAMDMLVSEKRIYLPPSPNFKH